MRSILKCEQLSRVYLQGEGSVTALAPTSLEFEEGEFTAITGRSGSGKSTLLHLLGGLDCPTGGEVWIEGIPLYSLSDAKRTKLRSSKIGFVFQSYNLIPELSVMENIRLPLDFGGKKVNLEEIHDLLHLLRLENRADFYPTQLSGGQQQRVAIARALAAKPAVILADEPTGNLDVSTGEEVLSYLQMLNLKFHQAILIVTHDPAVAALAGRNLTLEDGRILSDVKRG